MTRILPTPLSKPVSASSAKLFSRSLPFVSADEMDNVDAHLPKGQGSDPTRVEASQPSAASFNNLADRLTHVEEATDTTLTDIVEELKSDIGCVESRLTDLDK